MLELVNDEQDLDAARLADRLIERWKMHEVRQIRHPNVFLVSARAIGGRVQLTQGTVGEDRRIRIRIDYDRELESNVNAAVRQLEADGFRQVFHVEDKTGQSN